MARAKVPGTSGLPVPALPEYKKTGKNDRICHKKNAPTTSL
jgi:hypothetical protein